MNESLRRDGNVTGGQDSCDFKGRSARLALRARLTERGRSQSGSRTNQVLRTLWATFCHCLESHNIEMAHAVIHRLKSASMWPRCGIVAPDCRGILSRTADPFFTINDSYPEADCAYHFVRAHGHLAVAAAGQVPSGLRLITFAIMTCSLAARACGRPPIRVASSADRGPVTIWTTV